ncbi:MAG: phosphoribosyl-ATP diphosphatase [Pseudomonadota bacterium]|nr:phosphoribosyl-ATP diphosphatase [Pseudomonadota bacterium]
MAKDDIDILMRLYEVIDSRKTDDADTSYTAQLFSQGSSRIAQKLGEEAIETVIAVINDDRQATISESADLIYHMLVAWADAGIHPSDVMAELGDREGTSGLAAKRGRNK